jgi:hypothetical protein
MAILQADAPPIARALSRGIRIRWGRVSVLALLGVFWAVVICSAMHILHAM